MGRAPCCDKANVKRGPWSPEEDTALRNYLERHGTGGNWIALPQKAGLRRCGKSCRLRWLNYLRPDIKHGGFTEEEDNIICSLYKSIGSRWSVIASQLPGRTDNDVKNYWNTKLKKKLFGGKSNSLTTNNFIINAENHTHQLISSSSSPASVIKSEYEYETLGFSKYTKNSTALPLPMNVFLEQNVNSSRDPIQFNLHNGLTEPSYGLGPTASYSQSTSSSQEISSLSVAPCNALDNGNISWWPSNAGDEYDGLLMDFGFGSSCDVLSGLGGHDQRNNETAPNLANSNFLANTY